MKAGVEVRLGSSVIHYDFELGTVRLENAMELQADIVIEVDGVNSVARKAFLPDVGDGLEKTGWAAYRTMASVDKIKANPKIAHIVAQQKCNCWVGDRKLVMSYLVNNNEMLNLVLSHPDDVDTSKWTSEQCQAELKQLYSSWNPALAALLNIASPNIQNWPVHQVKSLPKWTSKSEKFVLMGNAAHAMAFYPSMGVSLAVEDAEALTECLGLVEKGMTTLDRAMAIFEAVRKPRAEAVKRAGLHAGNILQLPPGRARNSRDQALATGGTDSGFMEDGRFYETKSLYSISDRQIRNWCYSYDAVEAVRKEWQRFQNAS